MRLLGKNAWQGGWPGVFSLGSQGTDTGEEVCGLVLGVWKYGLQEPRMRNLQARLASNSLCRQE